MRPLICVPLLCIPLICISSCASILIPRVHSLCRSPCVRCVHHFMCIPSCASPHMHPSHASSCVGPLVYVTSHAHPCVRPSACILSHNACERCVYLCASTSYVSLCASPDVRVPSCASIPVHFPRASAGIPQATPFRFFEGYIQLKSPVC